MERLPTHPSPTPRSAPRTLPALPLILQPAVIVWARIHLQYQLHGEPCPARGLRGSRAALSCPEGWGGQSSRQGWGSWPPPTGPAFLHPAGCRSLRSSLKIDGPERRPQLPTQAPAPTLPGPTLRCGQLPPKAARRAAMSPPPPRDQVTAINVTGSTCPSNAPVGGWSDPSSSQGQACKQTAEIWYFFPLKARPLSALKGQCHTQGAKWEDGGASKVPPRTDTRIYTVTGSASTPRLRGLCKPAQSREGRSGIGAFWKDAQGYSDGSDFGRAWRYLVATNCPGRF